MSARRKLSSVLQNESQFAAEVGGRVRKVRLQNGLSQAEFGKRLGVSGQQVQKYENGVNAIPLHRLLILASLYSLPPETFWSFNAPFPERIKGGDAGILQLVRAYKRIENPIMRRRLLQLIKEVADQCGAPQVA